jgi:tetratricopeptide (TPR) repeat protein
MYYLRSLGVCAVVASVGIATAFAGQPASPNLQKAADQCFGKLHVDWAALAAACSEVVKAKVTPTVKAGAYFNRGSAYLRLGGGVNALADFNEALKINPDFARALEARAGLLIGQGKIDLAITDLNKAISLDANSSAAYSNRGMAYLGKKDYSKALADLTRAVELEPSDPMSYSARGTAYVASGDLDHALADLNKALELDPKLLVGLLNRGHVYATKGEKARAKADFQAVLEIAPDNKEAKSELAALAKVGG